MTDIREVYYVTAIELLQNKDFVKEFDRLRGTNLCFTGTALELEIDEASGRLSHDLVLLLEFIRDVFLTEREWSNV